MTNFHDNLKEAMSIKGMTTKVLAAKTGLKEGTISNYLKTKGSLPNIENGLKIAEALGVSVKFLVTGFEDTEGEKLDKSNRQDFERKLKTISKLANVPENELATIDFIISQFTSKYHSSKS